MGLGSTLKHAWNVFSNQENKMRFYQGPANSSRPDRTRFRIPNERSIISSIYTRLAVDVASIEMRHVRIDDHQRYLEDIDSGLNNCLTVEANIDQAARAFRQDIVMSLFEWGVIALVPVDTTINPRVSGGYDIQTMRVGDIVQWYPYHVRVRVFNEKTQLKEEITVPKSTVAIIENPLYSVMNEPNSTLQRLLLKLNLLDVVDDKIASGKLDIIIQLPYVIKSEARRQQAMQRREDLEFQLKGSSYGIGYVDATEKVTQLNRPAENNLWTQVESLTEMLYAQLGLTAAVMDGTADEKAMLNYWNRSVEPILTAIVESMRRTFLTKTARTQKQWIMFFRDPFRLVPVENIAEIADKFTRNEIMTSNEIRQVVGMKPHSDPKADQLVNANMPANITGTEATPDDGAGGNSLATAFDEIDAAIEEALVGLSSNGSGPSASS